MLEMVRLSYKRMKASTSLFRQKGNAKRAIRTESLFLEETNILGNPTYRIFDSVTAVTRESLKRNHPLTFLAYAM